LPLISIQRKDITQELDDITGRGINQHTGDIVIKRRLSKRDRAYQNLLNKLNIKNQDNIPHSLAPLAPVASKDPSGEVGSLAHDRDVLDGYLMAPKLGDNIFEFITIPSPQFYTVNYEITFWTKYESMMNTLIEKLFASWLPQGTCLKLDTTNGYWFVAFFEGSITSDDNVDDSTGAERMLKRTFQVRVPAYTIAPRNPGDPSPIRRYVSAATVDFNVSVPGTGVPSSNAELYPNADDPTANFLLTGEPVLTHTDAMSQARINGTIFKTQIVQNPFTGRDDIKYVRVLPGRSRFGETVLQPDESMILVEPDNI
jgi:hypothetical protein